MAINAVCPKCRAAYRLIDQQEGKKIRCKRCEEVFVAEASPPQTAVRRDASAEVPARSNTTIARDTAPSRITPNETVDVRLRPRSKENDRLKVISIIVLAGAALLVLAAVGVGILRWQMLKPPSSGPAPVQTATPGPPGQPPPAIPGVRGPQRPIQGGPFQSLPAPPLLKEQPPPPLTPPKKLEFRAVRSFAGHDGPVFAVALSPDQHRLLSGGSDKAVRLWNLDRGEELGKFEGHTNAIRGVAFTPDGKQAASASLDGTVRLWDLAKQTKTRTLEGHKGAVLCLAFTPDGKQLLSGGSDRALRLWDVETGKQLQQWYGHDADVLCVSISPDGTTALTGSADGGATHWDLRSGRELAYFSVGQPVYFALFTVGGKRAILGGDGPARLCDLSNGEQWPEFPPAGPPLRGGALLPDDNVFLQVTGQRLEVRFLPMRHVNLGTLTDPRWNLLGEIEAHAGTITSVCASRNGRLALTAGEDGTVKLWSIRERDDGQAH